jgi:uncharacterized protein YbjT (DUF2867 family)
VAGASGFVGRALLRALAPDFEVVALGRGRPDEGAAAAPVSWRRCDLFSLRETEEALAGVDVAVYLVHSMMPSTRLTQARFEDLDLLLADNFGRAAARCGVARIVYLGGLVPHDAAELSAHLASRLEVERALGAHGTPVAALRAGLVVGAGGSSLRILVRLVRRLPVMLCPRWTSTLSQPIALADTVALLRAAITLPEAAGRVCEIGGPDVLSYREMMQATARVLGLRRWMFPVPFFSPGLSRLWVSLVTGTPLALVRPLVESLRHEMCAEDRWLQQRIGLEGERFERALAEAVAAPEPAPTPGRRRVASRARSVQRLPLPPGWNADAVAQAYLAWLPRFLRPLLRVSVDEGRCAIRTRGSVRTLLELEQRRDRSGPDRALFEVGGGELVQRGAEPAGRLEFRATPGGGSVIAAVHDFAPRLPWWLYVLTQAQAHRLVMRCFARHLARRERALAPPLPAPGTARR